MSIKNKRFAIIFYLFIIISFQDFTKIFAETKWRRYFSIQVKAFPRNEKANALSLYERLKNKGYLVYYYRTKVKGEWWIRVRIGAFSEKSKAIEFGNIIKKNEGIDFYVDPGNVMIENFKNKFKIITTPSGIWAQSDSINEELFSFSPKLYKADILMETKALISPSGKEIVFYYDEKIIKVNISKKNVKILKENNLWNSSPHWSPDGKYIAYLDFLEWEVRTSLWIMKSDGNGDTCIVDCRNKPNSKVKSFSWHPEKNEIFYIQGNAYGAMDIGGNLFITDIYGDNFLAVETSPINEIKISFFRVENDSIFLTIVQLKEGMAAGKRLYRKLAFDKIYQGVVITPEFLNLK